MYAHAHDACYNYIPVVYFGTHSMETILQYTEQNSPDVAQLLVIVYVIASSLQNINKIIRNYLPQIQKCNY